MRFYTYHPVRLLVIAALALAGLVMLAACGDDPQPVLVYVTPTPDGAASGLSGPTSTATPETVALSSQNTGESSSENSQPIITASPTPTITPTPTRPPATPTPTIAAGVTFGPIVGPGHTLAPTETRVPPSPIPTVIPTSGPSPTPLPGLRADLMGVQIHAQIDSQEFARVIDHAQALGVQWVKYQFNWSLLESAPGQYTEMFYLLRLYVQRAHDQGFKVLVSVAKAPGWSRTPDAEGIMRENGPPDDPQHLANFIAGMLNYMGRDEQGRPYVSAVEIWNEPNLEREWWGYPMTGEDYMRYFRPAYEAARAYAPEIVVVTAGPAPTGDSEWSTNDRVWLQGLYDAGLAQYGANVAVGIHPYAWANAPDARCCPAESNGWDEYPQFFYLDTIEDYRDMMERYGHGAAQLWATEFGWATFDGMATNGGSGPPPPAPPDALYFDYINRWDQAHYTVRAFEIGQSLPYMGPMFLWNLNFATIPGAVDQGDPQTAYGLLDALWQPRPVYQLVQQIPKQ
ncbi:MAG: hypothetical protein JXQ72_04965 [Anaerolineae bacterium]|nr:hypothetical protein [Anaerolineae bacterium]